MRNSTTTADCAQRLRGLSQSAMYNQAAARPATIGRMIHDRQITAGKNQHDDGKCRRRPVAGTRRKAAENAARDRPGGKGEQSECQHSGPVSRIGLAEEARQILNRSADDVRMPVIEGRAGQKGQRVPMRDERDVHQRPEAAIEQSRDQQKQQRGSPRPDAGSEPRGGGRRGGRRSPPGRRSGGTHRHHPHSPEVEPNVPSSAPKRQ